MISRINTGANPGGAVRYNEEKVKHGEARVLSVLNYPTDKTSDLSVKFKIEILEDYAQLNERVSKPTFHVSLAFHPNEVLTDEKLLAISQEYMERIGYGDQPMLIYRHEDTQHPHVHIVSISVNDEGKRISDSNINYRSDAIRKDIEIKYNLVKAEEMGKGIMFDAFALDNKVDYGKTETKKAIGSIVQTVLKDYNFASVDCFARVLENYNVQMNQLSGKTKSGVEFQGITFQIRNEEGPVSPAIKASQYHFAPTRKRLESRANQSQKQLLKYSPAVTYSIQQALSPYAKFTEQDYRNALRETGIQLLDNGKTFVYVDHQRKLIYGENELGADFSRAQLEKTFSARSELRIDTTVSNKVSTIEIDKPNLSTTIRKGVPPTLGENELKTLQKLVGRLYQDYRKTEGPYFESQLIEKFPFQLFTEQLIKSGIAIGDAQTAVRSFEMYKQGQLAEIKIKEEDYFKQTATAYLKLAQQMPIAPEGRIQFLQAAGLKREQLPSGEMALIHAQHPGMRYPLLLADDHKLLMGSGPIVPFMRPFTKSERSVYLAAATGSTVGKISFYEINPQQVKACLPQPILAQISRELNSNYLQSIGKHLDHKAGDVSGQLLQRGVLIIRDRGETRAGFMDSPISSYVPIPNEIQTQSQSIQLSSQYDHLSRQIQETQLGRSLVQLAQGIDMQSQTRFEFVVKRLSNQGISAEGLAAKPLLEKLWGTLNQLTTIPKQASALTVPVGIGNNRNAQSKDGLSKSKPEGASISELLWKDYFGFRNKNGYFYESPLLKAIDAFPQTRLVTMLQGEPHHLTPQAAMQAVLSFKTDRMNKLPRIEEKDMAHFKSISQGFISMVNNSPLSPGDRIKVLRALYLNTEQTNSGGLTLVHTQHKEFAMLLTEDQQKGLLHQPQKAARIELPYIEFPRQERKLYELVATGKILKANPTDKQPITFASINGERAKTIIPPEAWKQREAQLNRDTIDSLLKLAPIRSEERITWLYQRGIVIEKTNSGTYKAGHYLTDKQSFQPLSKTQAAALDTSTIPLQTELRLKGLESERGQIMISLGRAIDQKNEKRAINIVNRVIERAPAFSAFAGKPMELLNELSRRTGPLVQQQERPLQPVIDTGARSTTQVDNLLQDGGTASTGGLLDALADGSDTSIMKKKNSLNSTIKRSPKRRL